MILQSGPYPHWLKILIIVLAACFQSAAYSAERVDRKTVQHLDSFRKSYSESWLNGSADLMAPYYADDIRLMPEFQQTVIGRENAIKYHRAFNDRFSVTSVKREEIETLDLGGQIAELGTFKQVLQVKTSGQIFEIEGTYLNL